MAPDPYKVLKIERSADLDTIKRAYRQAAEKHHPDRGGDGWAFQEVHAAYEFLLAKHASHESASTSNDDKESKQGQTGKNRTTRQPSQNHPSSTQESVQQNKQESAVERARLGLKGWLNSFTEELPLQSETTYFILVNVLDFYLTYMLLNTNAIEANPLAAFVFRPMGFSRHAGLQDDSCRNRLYCGAGHCKAKVEHCTNGVVGRDRSSWWCCHLQRIFAAWPILVTLTFSVEQR